jgi:hypothetical protein
MRTLFSIAALGGIALLTANGPAEPTGAAPVVVELFTSQGCSSCPPADAYFEELSAKPGVIAITRPVTYWDRLGWKDTLAREENSQLQRAYAAHGGEGEGVYTPQTMVQGRFGAVGSERTLIASQIERARKSISVAVAARPGFVGVAGKGGPAEVKLISLKSSRIIKIAGGENGGRVIRYSNIVVGERSLGRWLGAAQSFAIPIDKPFGTDRQIVVVQTLNAGPILGSAIL